MDFVITPFVGAGPIRFDMSRNEVRELLHVEFREFRKTPLSKTMTDEFSKFDIHVFYDEDNCCKGIEMFPSARAFLSGRELIGQPFSSIAATLQEGDPSLQITDSGLISRVFGISLYAPGIDSNMNSPIESAYAFRKGAFGT